MFPSYIFEVNYLDITKDKQHLILVSNFSSILEALSDIENKIESFKRVI